MTQTDMGELNVKMGGISEWRSTIICYHPQNSVNSEQIARAKEIRIEDYILAREPNNVRRIGSAYYLKDHESLEISNGLWNWHSRGIGGKNVIDYLMKVREYSFVDAVLELTGDDGHNYTIPQKSKPPPERKPFILPPRNRGNERVIAYLEGRGIDKPLILDCIERGSLYESAGYRNCVFVGRDQSGKARFAALRGTTGDFKCDVEGSDKRFGFILPPKLPDSEMVAVCEAPIDALSHQSLYPEFGGWRLSLGGTALVALTHFLESHPEITHCIISTDNDEAGNRVAAEISEKLNITVSRSVPAGKDWNETLKSIRNKVMDMEDVRKNIRFIDSKYKTLFTVKDGENIKYTNGYDGEVKYLKCRFIDDAHLTLIGKYHNDYHICEFAEILERNGSKCEPIPDQKPTLNILAAKYGEPLQDVEIPMTDAAIKKLVGGNYEAETLSNWDKSYVYGAVVRGKNGIAVCGVGGENNTLTSLHPYWAQKYKRELSSAEPPVQDVPVKKKSLLGGLEEAKTAVAEINAANAHSIRQAKRGASEVR